MSIYLVIPSNSEFLLLLWIIASGDFNMRISLVDGDSSC